jgi:hypothetical protein
MHFSMKNYLKINHYRTAKYTLSVDGDLIVQFQWNDTSLAFRDQHHVG